MSGSLPRAPAPFIAPTSGDIDQRLHQVANAINKKADTTTMPTYASVRLIAPNGTVYAVSVDNSGAISTAVVPR